MKPLELREWAEALRLSGDHQISDFGKEVLDLIDLEQRREYLEELAEDLTWPEDLKRFKNDERKAADFLIDRHNLLTEMEDMLDAANPGAGPYMALENVLGELWNLREKLAALKAPEYDL